jgi:hypothetical protein
MADLVTAAEVAAAWSGFSSLGASEQAALVTAGSDAVEAYCDRVFTEGTFTDRIDGTNLPSVWLKATPISSVTSVTLDGAVLPVADYSLDTVTGQLWRGPWGPGDANHRHCWPSGVGNIVVVYVAGYATIPPLVKRATILAVKRLSEADSGGLTMERLGDYSYTLSDGGHVVPDPAKALLRPYLRRRMAFV